MNALSNISWELSSTSESDLFPRDSSATSELARDQTALLALTEQANAGVASAQNQLGNFYENGLGLDADFVQAVHWYRKAAEQGHADSQCKLGDCYHIGQGVPQELEEALRWFRMAADMNHAAAQSKLGYYYEQGWAVRQSYEEATRWFEKAAEQGDTIAQVRLGYLYRYGMGVKQDLETSAKWYEQAALNGRAQAQRIIAGVLEDGLGMPKDVKQAAIWYETAAKQGDVASQVRLAEIILDEFHTAERVPEACRWLEAAANAGNVQAARRLAEMHFHGDRMKKDYKQAAKLYRLASDRAIAQEEDKNDRIRDLQEQVRTLNMQNQQLETQVDQLRDLFDESKAITQEFGKRLDASNAVVVAMEQKFGRLDSTERPQGLPEHPTAQEVFDHFDADRDGMIDKSEFRAMCSEMNRGLTDDQVAEMLRDADTNGDGRISRDEFVRINNDNQTWRDRVFRAFKLFG